MINRVKLPTCHNPLSPLFTIAPNPTARTCCKTLKGNNMSPLLHPILALVLSGLAWSSATPAAFGCPLQGVPAPCECFEAFGNAFFRCSGVRDPRQIVRSAEAMSGLAVTRFELADSELTHLPHDLFANVTSVLRLQVRNSVLFHLFDRELVVGGAADLEEVKLEAVAFEGGLDWSVLENLPKLREVSASRCDLRSVSSVLDLAALDTLLLPDNDLEHLHPLAFSLLDNLRNLQLRRNRLEDMKRSMFAHPACGLQFLDLSYNKLSSLPSDIFEGMPQLNSLILRGNSFFVLEKSYMRSAFAALLFFDVDENPLKCGCELSWVLSDNRPVHFFGGCSLEETADSKYLRDLMPVDFVACVDDDDE